MESIRSKIPSNLGLIIHNSRSCVLKKKEATLAAPALSTVLEIISFTVVKDVADEERGVVVAEVAESNPHHQTILMVMWALPQ